MARTSIPAPVDTAWRHTIALLDRLFPPPRSFAIRLWDGTRLLATLGAAPFTLALNHPGALRRMFAPPIELSLGEAFICGDFEIDGDIFAAVALFDDLSARQLSIRDLANVARDLLALPKPAARFAGRGPARLRGALHSRERDRAAIQYHYDIGNDFYAAWLDAHMQYSCAYFATGTEDLDTAQERKLDYICRKLQLKHGERLLDIGCGWGGLVMYAAERYGVAVLGITLSEQQAYYANAQIARAGLGARACVKLCDYRSIGAGWFDKIVSVGMFEHVGVGRLPEYFAHAYRLLIPGGLFLNHGIARRASLPAALAGTAACCAPRRASREVGWQDSLRRWLLGEGQFAQRYVFPDGELAPVSAVNLAAEQAGFEVRDVENLREHYALTLRHWVSRLEARQDEVIAISDEATYRTWRLYLAASAHGFECGAISVNQTLLSKAGRGRSSLPLTRADLYVH